MRSLWIASLAGLVLIFLVPSIPAQTTPQAIAITHVNVIPMTNDSVLADQTVVIEGQRIRTIQTASRARFPRGAKKIDGTGLYLIPGLIDAHVHLYAPQHLRLYLANGVTTVFNLNGRPPHLVWREEIAKGDRLGPRIYTVGPKFSRADPPEKAVALVDEYAKEGYDGIKIYNQVSKQEYPPLIAEAKKHNLLIVGHISPNVGFEATLQAGQAIAHAEEYLYTYFQDHAKDGAPDPSLIPQVAAMTKAAGVPVIATLVTYEHILEQATDFKTFLHRPEMGFWAPWELEEIKDPSQNAYLNMGSDDVAILRRNYPFQKTLVKALHDAGVPILAGTDSGSIISVPGFALHEELEILVQSGLTPFEALQSATIYPARYLRGEKEFGTVEEGKVADLILLRANPLADIANTKQIATVVVRGRCFDETELAQFLQQTPADYAKEESTAKEDFARNPQQAMTFLKSVDPFFELGSTVLVEIALAKGVSQIEPLIRSAAQADRESALNSPDVLNDLADALLQKKKIDDAMELFQFNVAEHPNSAIAYDRLGRAYRSLGQYALALKSYQKAIEIDPSYWNADTAKRRIGELTKQLDTHKN